MTGRTIKLAPGFQGHPIFQFKYKISLQQEIVFLILICTITKKRWFYRQVLYIVIPLLVIIVKIIVSHFNRPITSR